MKHPLILSILVAAAVCAAGTSSAAGYPERPIRLVLPFPPGGGTDAIARIITPRLTESMGVSFVIDNRSGAAGNIANEIVARSAPDGHTLAMGFSTTLTVNPHLYKLPFDVMKDFSPITQLATAQYFLVLHPSVPANSFKEFIALAKAKPGTMNFASSGVGSPLHLAGELLGQRAGAKLVHVAYKGGGPAGAAVLAGEVQVLFGSVAATLQHIKSGRLKALAVSGPKRSPLMPELPTVEESGYPGFQVTAWDSVLAPANTPPAIVERLNTEIRRVLNNPDVRKNFMNVGYDVTGTTPAELAQIIRTESDVWKAVIKSADVKVE